MKKLISIFLAFSVLFFMTPHTAYAAGVALDTSTLGASQAGGVAGTTYTFSHTMSSASGGILVAVFAKDSGSADVCSAVTYNGVAMTEVGTRIASGLGVLDMWIMANPATGANNITCTLNQDLSNKMRGMAVSYTGAGPLDLSTVDSGTASSVSSITKSITTAHTNSWVVGAAMNSSPPSVGAGVTDRQSISTNGTGEAELGDSNGAQPVGTYSMTWSGSTNSWAWIMVEIQPPSAVFNPYYFWDF